MTTFETIFAELNPTEVTLYCSWVRMFNESVELAMQGNQQQADELQTAMNRIEDAFERKGIDTMALFY